jgi:ADP-ribose pyrophosphatase
MEQGMRKNGPWMVLTTEELYRDPSFTLTRDEVIRPDGQPGTFNVARAKPGVAVLALDDAGCCHLTEEFRYGVGRWSLEVAGGDREPGEEPPAAARRVLRDDLGIEAAEWTALGGLDPFTSLLVAPVHLFLARGLRFSAPLREATDLLRPVQLPLEEAVRAVLDGRITHGPSCVLLLRAQLQTPGRRAA